MKKFKLSIIAPTAIILLLSGCASSVSSFKEVKQEGEAVVAKAYEHAINEKELPHIRYSDEFYVPELKNATRTNPNGFLKKQKGHTLTIR